ncbi:MAG: class I SAM-dependent methyltransferase [Dysosmobacter sp.]
MDLACGTGTIACLLAAKGYAVTATDLSEEMLTQAMSKAADLEQPPLFCAAVHAPASSAGAGGCRGVHAGFPELSDPGKRIFGRPSGGYFAR